MLTTCFRLIVVECYEFSLNLCATLLTPTGQGLPVAHRTNWNDFHAMSQLQSISKSKTHAELNQAIGARIASMNFLDTPVDGAPLECAVYASQKSVAFEAGDNEVFRLRTNFGVNRAQFLAKVQAWSAVASALPISSPDRNVITAVSTYYDLERQFTVQAQVWADNEDLTKILNFGNQDKAILGLLTKEEFAVKATGEVVTAWRLNRCVFQGVDSQKGTKVAVSDLAFLGIAQPVQQPVQQPVIVGGGATGMKLFNGAPIAGASLLALGIPQATIDALPNA